MLYIDPSLLLFSLFEHNTIIGFADNFIFGARTAADVDLLIFSFIYFYNYVRLFAQQ